MSDQPLTLGHLLAARAAATPKRDAVVFPTARRGYGTLYERARGHAKSLMALGVAPGEHVGLLMPACMEFVELIFAVALAGAVAVPINARYRGGELA
ncbi:MAG: AMP-dependent synthetase, partial [Alphaproteobacteria bacterium]